jgi:hypothetical protein
MPLQPCKVRELGQVERWICILWIFLVFLKQILSCGRGCMVKWSLWHYRNRLGILALCFLIAACGSSPQEPLTPDSDALSSSAPAEVPAEGAEEEQELTPPSFGTETAQLLTPSTPADRSTVLAGKELGMIVTGMRAGSLGRSLDTLEGQVLSFLPQLQEAYDREREQDPGLMGSLEVSLVIEPTGRVSDVRFPRSRVSSDKLVATMFDRMRTWTFPPAEDKVQLRYTVLFVPPGMDHASILMWEKYLGNRTVIDRSGEEVTEVAVAMPPAPVEKPAARIPPPERPKAVKRPTPPPPTRAETTRRPSETAVVGWYQVTRSAALHAAPRDASDILAQLRAGTRVRVVGVVDGEWLEVRSVSNRPPGFLRRGNARPDAATTRAREGGRF